jgi:hypothetical protein
LVANAGLVLARKMADASGLTAGLGRCYPDGRAGAGKLDRGVLVAGGGLAIIAGARTLRRCEALLGCHLDTFGATGSDTTLWRTLGETKGRVLDRLAGARARARRWVWDQLARRVGGFPWVQAAGKTLTGWVVLDLDATLVDAHSDKDGAAPTFKKGFGHHPLGAWCANTGEALVLKLRAGNAGSNTASDHQQVLDAAFAQLPPGRASGQVLVRIDGAGATHETINGLVKRTTTRKKVVFTCGWAITGADEKAITAVPGHAWEAYLDQDGKPVVPPPGQEDKPAGVAELTDLDQRLAHWPAGTRLVARRVPITPRDTQLTALETTTGYRYHITATNIPPRGLTGVPGSTHPQFLDALHRQHAVVEDRVRTAKAAGLGHLPSKKWDINAAWLAATAIGIDLDAWVRLLGFNGTPLAKAEPDMMRHHVYNTVGRLARHARKRYLRIDQANPAAIWITTAWHTITNLRT